MSFFDQEMSRIQRESVERDKEERERRKEENRRPPVPRSTKHTECVCRKCGGVFMKCDGEDWLCQNCQERKRLGMD